MKSGALLVLLCSMLACQAAAGNGAPRRSVSYSEWRLEQDSVTVRLTVPAAEAASLVGAALPLLSTENLASYVLDHMSVTAGGAPCAPADQGYDIGRINPLSLGADLYGFEILFRCVAPGPKSLHNGVMFAEVPQHIDFARIEKDGIRTRQLFTATRQELSIPSGKPLPAAGAAPFLMLGSSHAWRSADRLCAILGLFMLARTPRRLSAALAALGAGYAASILLVSAGLVAEVGTLEAGMGFIVASMAAALAAQALQQRQDHAMSVVIATGGSLLMLSVAALLAHRPSVALTLVGFAIVGAAVARAAAVGSWLPILILPAASGLLDGFVLPGDYERVQQWGEISLRNLAAFDGGALLIDALLLGALAALAGLAAFAAPKRAAAPIADDLAASALAGLGSFWLLSRLF